MHLGNSVICPVTGIPMILAAGGAIVFASIKAERNSLKKVAAMTALVFALQMINFSIPSAASSGHIIGGLLLAICLGRFTGFLAMSVIILAQALLFADGGLSAIGLNIFNMGAIACFVVYPFIYKPLESKNKFLACMVSSLAALELGSIAIGAEAYLSGAVKNLPLFIGLMTSIHFVIGLVEGIFTYCTLKIIDKTKNADFIFASVSLILAGFISNYASTKPDGLEWSLLSIGQAFEAQTQNNLFFVSELLQAKISVLASVSSFWGNIIGLGLATMGVVVIYSIISKIKSSKERV